MSQRAHARGLFGLVAAATGVALLIAALAFASPMHSTKLGPRLCETTGGGKFVRIPGFPGEMIDRRLLTDIRWLQSRYPIFITDGYSMDDVHATNGEHPIGLALDIVPDKAEGGRWADITRLARWAEPRQNHPRLPFRWVGYDGDANHGRGNHLHLSWSHSVTRPGRAGEDRRHDPLPGPRRPGAAPAATDRAADAARAASPTRADGRGDELGSPRVAGADASATVRRAAATAVAITMAGGRAAATDATRAAAAITAATAPATTPAASGTRTAACRSPAASAAASWRRAAAASRRWCPKPTASASSAVG